LAALISASSSLVVFPSGRSIARSRKIKFDAVEFFKKKFKVVFVDCHSHSRSLNSSIRKMLNKIL
jgi:hypothetical protein